MLRASLRLVSFVSLLALCACGDDVTADRELTPEELVARGEYLVTAVTACADCHTPRDANGPVAELYMAGNPCWIDVVPGDDTQGCLRTPNLTNDPTGLANRSDAEIREMFQNGVRPDGSILSPEMPYWAFHNITDEDADAIVAFLRTVPGVENRPGDSQPPFDAPLPAAALPVPLEEVPMPAADYPEYDAAMQGRYLAANTGICLECHTPGTEPGTPHPRDYSRSFQGGREFPAVFIGLPSPPFPEVVVTPNITPHMETGVGAHGVEGIVQVLQQGIDPDGEGTCPPMPVGPMGAFANLTDEDAEAIAHFLMSIAPVEAENAPGDCQAP